MDDLDDLSKEALFGWLADVLCTSVGIVEYSGFARTIDERIETTCLSCPPDPIPAGAWCVREFKLRLPDFP